MLEHPICALNIFKLALGEELREINYEKKILSTINIIAFVYADFYIQFFVAGLSDRLIGGIWWRHLMSGAIAGAISRTCTAPLDRDI